MPVFVTNATSPSPPPPPSPPPTTPREMKSVALVLALALLDSARGQVCSTADVECVTAPRTYTCTWPAELAGEQPDDITCEQSSQEAGSGGLQHRQLRWRERWLLQFEPCPLLHRRPFRRVHDVHAVSRR